MRWALLCAGVGLVGGCAQASIGNAPPDTSNHGGSDASFVFDTAPRIDAPPPIDAARTIDMMETINATMTYGISLTCSDTGTGNTRDNIWYRVYRPSDFSVTDAFHITGVTFSVQESTGTPTATIKVGTYTGTIDATTLNAALISPLAMATAPVPATSGQTGENVIVPIAATIPAGAMFVVQVSLPDQDATGYMYIGATNAGEHHPGYLSSAACSITTPTTTVSIAEGAGITAGEIIIDVEGEY